MDDINDAPSTLKEHLQRQVEKTLELTEKNAQNLASIFNMFGCALFAFFMILHFFIDKENWPLSLSAMQFDTYLAGFMSLILFMIVGEIVRFFLVMFVKSCIWRSY